MVIKRETAVVIKLTPHEAGRLSDSLNPKQQNSVAEAELLEEFIHQLNKIA